MAADAAFKSKPFHKKPVLIQDYVMCFVRVAWPLEPSIGQSFTAETKAISFKYETLDPVFSGAAEEKEGAIFERVHAIAESNERCQAINPAPKIGPASKDYGPFDRYTRLKHISPPPITAG